MIQALVFDFDGVIVDSEPLHYQAILRIASRWDYVFSYSHYLERYLGFDDREVFLALLHDSGKAAGAGPELLEDLIREKGDWYEELVHQGIPPVTGTVEFIRRLDGRVPVAIASGATRRDILLSLHAIGLDGVFDLIVPADEVTRSKPDPETYRLACHRLAARHPGLELRPERCLAVEDSPQGIESARGAGLPVLALTTTQPPAALGRAHRIIPSLQEYSWEALRDLLA